MGLLIVDLLMVLINLVLLIVDVVSVLFFLPVASMMYVGELFIDRHYYGANNSSRSIISNNMTFYIIFPLYWFIITFGVPSIVLYPLYTIYASYAFYLSTESTSFWVTIASMAVVSIAVVSLTIRCFIVCDNNRYPLMRRMSWDFWWSIQASAFYFIISLVVFALNPIRLVLFLTKAFNHPMTASTFHTFLSGHVEKAALDIITVPFVVSSLDLWFLSF